MRLRMSGREQSLARESIPAPRWSTGRRTFEIYQRMEMNLLTPTALSPSLFASISILTRSGSQPSRHGPAAYFTGSLRIDPLIAANNPSRASGVRVTFEPGARIAWHTHLPGQILLGTHHRLAAAMGRSNPGNPAR